MKSGFWNVSDRMHRLGSCVECYHTLDGIRLGRSVIVIISAQQSGAIQVMFYSRGPFRRTVPVVWPL